ncbi:response regulator [Aerococcaceae bacterium zg-ZUI334]|uniref:response regulator transcription factor n=1 Tax=Aerococcaceae bacterium zg-252 TaxID=2796928 RepID=UPI001B9E8A5D|nr:response regulator [Aerococcaceae bacterium zg-ZUI334]
MYNFLLVDDEILIRKGTLKKISNLNLPVKCTAEAANGKEAIRQLTSQEFDFIITDMDMPDIDGMQLLDYLKQHHPNIPVIIISGYQKFEYLQKSIQVRAVNYILKPFSKQDIEESIKQTISILNEHNQNKINQNDLIQSAILGHNTKYAIQILSELLNESKPIYLVLSEIELPNSNFKTFKKYMIAPNNYYVYFVLDDYLDAFINESKQYNSVIVIGQEIKAAEQIHDYFVNCVKALNSIYTSNSDKIIWVKQTEEVHSDCHFPHKDSLLFFLQKGDTNKLFSQLSADFEQLILGENRTLYEVKQAILNLMSDLKQFLAISYNMNTNYSLPEETAYIMERLLSFDTTVKYAHDYFKNICQSLKFENIYNSTNIVDNIMQYINLNYPKRITLDLLSDLFFLNPSYISKLFKENTNSNYIDYLNSIRIKNAKLLIEKSNKKISLIANEVGYENEKYFFRVFKKYTGMTPEQYKHVTKLN